MKTVAKRTRSLAAKSPRVSAAAKWLHRFRWTFVGTLTFRNEVSTEDARRDFLRWIKRVSELLGANPTWFYSIERGIGKHVHLHVRLHTRSETTRTAIRRLWKAGFSEIRRDENNKATAIYLTKNLSNPAAEWDVSVEMPPRRLAKPKKVKTRSRRRAKARDLSSSPC